MRRALVTGARGFVAWPCRALLARRVRCGCLTGSTAADGPRRRRAPRRWRCSGSVTRSRRSGATARRRPGSRRPVAGCRHGLPPRRRDDRRRRPRVAARGLRHQRARHLERARSLPRGAGSGGSSSPPPTRPTAPAPSCPTARTSRCEPPTPYEASKAAADLIARCYAQLRPAGGGDPLRQHLRRRRSQLLAAGAGGGLRGARRPRRRCCAPTAAPSATCSTSRMPPPPIWRSPTTSTRRRAAARPSTPAASGPTGCSRSSRRSPQLAGTGRRARDPRQRQSRGRDRPPVRRRGQAARAAAGRRGSGSGTV